MGTAIRIVLAAMGIGLIAWNAGTLIRSRRCSCRKQIPASSDDADVSVVVVHGTDRLARTGERICEVAGGEPPCPIVLTGAMQPYALRTTDSIQNLTEALLAVQLVPKGVYVAMHNKVLAFPGVVKDIEAGTFRRGG